MIKINMSKPLLVSALFTGLLCGMWAGVAPIINLSVWAGFAGCTAYFASGKHKLEGVLMTIATNLVGVASAAAMIWSGENLFGFLAGGVGGAVATGVIVSFIVLCASINWLSFVPGIFVGCYSFFAINGDWQLLSLSLVAGIILGLACEQGGVWFSKILGLENNNR